MTLAVILAVGSLFASGIAGAHPLLLSTPTILPEQSTDARAPQAPQAQDQSSKDAESTQQPTKEASPPTQQPDQSPPLKTGNANAQEGKTSVENPAEGAASPEKSVKEQHPPRKSKHKKVSSKTSSGSRKIVVRDGGTAEPTTQLTPGMPHDQVARSQETTTWLLSSTEANLKRASTRTLSSNQQATIQQIKIFMDQASAAMKDGDFQRGHNLAMKAHLLSDDLLKH